MKGVQGQISLFDIEPRLEPEPENILCLPCDTCGYDVQGCCDYPVTTDDYCILGDKWIPNVEPGDWVEEGCLGERLSFDDITRLVGQIYRYGFGKSLEAYHQGKGIIEQTAAEYNNGWIPVESGLPERNKPVLVYAESKTISGGTITMVGACNNGFWFVQSGVDTLGFPCRDYKVIAWQPLPESYQPKGE